MAKSKAKKHDTVVVFKVSYLMCLPIIVKLLHSIQVLTDNSNKVGHVSLTFQTKQLPNKLSFTVKKKQQLDDPHKKFEWHFSGRLTFLNTCSRLFIEFID